MAYSLVFRHHDKTLEESEITAAMKKILNGLTRPWNRVEKLMLTLCIKTWDNSVE